MKKVFLVIITVLSGNDKKSKFFYDILCHTKVEAKRVIADQKEFDEEHLLSRNHKYDYFIMEGLIITQEKIKSIIDNSNVE